MVVGMSNYPSLLPHSSTQLERDLEQMGMFANDVGNLDLSIIHNPYLCPFALLPWLAWTRHVDNYDDAWPEQKKRDVIAGSPEVHEIKGTVFSIREVIRFAGYGEIEIKTWGFHWFYNGVRTYNGTIKYGEASALGWAQFEVTLQTQVTTRQAQIIRALINTTAPARCELVELNYNQAIIYNGQHNYDGQFSYGVD